MENGTPTEIFHRSSVAVCEPLRPEVEWLHSAEIMSGSSATEAE